MLAVMLFASDCTHDVSETPMVAGDDSWRTAVSYTHLTLPTSTHV